MLTGDHRCVAEETCRSLGIVGPIIGPERLPDLSVPEMAESAAQASP